jgi:hypothetical protein
MLVIRPHFYSVLRFAESANQYNLVHAAALFRWNDAGLVVGSTPEIV